MIRGWIGSAGVAVLLFALSLPAWPQGAAVSEYALKATLLFRLPQFVYRPDEDRTQTQFLCVLGSNPFGGALERLAKTAGDGRSVRVWHPPTAGEAGDCAFIFISRSEASHLDMILKRLARQAVVTVSDIEGFARAGGMIELALGDEGSAISVLVNRRAGQRQNIEFNAQLLRLAKVVEP